MSDVWDAGCWGWGMLGIWDVADVECSRCGMFGMWDIRDVECSGCGMFRMWDVGGGGGGRMWDVGDVGCSECGMFGMRDVGCGIFAGMWDVDLQNALRGHEIFYEFSNQTFPLHGYEICSSFLCALNLPEF